MPTYRYRCERCGDEMEVWQSFSEEPLAEHDTACGGKLNRVLTPAGIVLKGSGFYRNDSGASSTKKSGGSKPSKDKDSSGNDSKPSSSSGSKDKSSESTPASASSGSGDSSS